MSCHNGNIPTRQEFVLFRRKKHYSLVEKTSMERWDVMIFEILQFEGRLKNRQFNKEPLEGLTNGTLISSHGTLLVLSEQVLPSTPFGSPGFLKASATGS